MNTCRWCRPVAGMCEVTQLSIGQSDERVLDCTDAGDIGHLHGDVFQLRKPGIGIALRLENVLPPQADDGELFGLVLPASVYIQRHLGLNTSHGCACPNYLLGKFRHILPGVWKGRDSGRAKELSGTSGVEINLPTFQFLITV